MILRLFITFLSLQYKYYVMVCYWASSKFMFSDITFVTGGSLYATKIGKHKKIRGTPPFPKLLLNQNPSTGFSVLPLPDYVFDQDIAFLLLAYFQIYKMKSYLLPSAGRCGLKEQGKPHLWTQFVCWFLVLLFTRCLSFGNSRRAPFIYSLIHRMITKHLLRARHGDKMVRKTSTISFLEELST